MNENKRDRMNPQQPPQEKRDVGQRPEDLESQGEQKGAQQVPSSERERPMPK